VLFAGWIVGIHEVRGIFPGFATMKANTALGFLLSGCAILIISRSNDTRRRMAAKVLAGLLLVMAVLTFAESAFGVDIGIDQLLARDPDSAVAPGRMSAATATCFALLAGASRSGGGLGLAIVKRLMDLHRGEVRLKSGERVGTTVTLVFPKDRLISADEDAFRQSA